MVIESNIQILSAAPTPQKDMHHPWCGSLNNNHPGMLVAGTGVKKQAAVHSALRPFLCLPADNHTRYKKSYSIIGAISQYGRNIWGCVAIYSQQVAKKGANAVTTTVSALLNTLSIEVGYRAGHVYAGLCFGISFFAYKDGLVTFYRAGHVNARPFLCCGGAGLC